MLRKTLKRANVMSFFGKLLPCLIGMEACGSAHFWARKLTEMGHTVKLMAPQFVKPYVKTGLRGRIPRLDGASHERTRSRCLSQRIVSTDLLSQSDEAGGFPAQRRRLPCGELLKKDSAWLTKSAQKRAPGASDRCDTFAVPRAHSK
jgi:hypothetical protein